jgi:ABC-type dipeptide/oligopeptide/nickel transport system permease subunit
MKATAGMAAPAPETAGGIARVRVRTNLQLARQRFARQRLAMVGLGITLFLIALAVFAPIIAPTHYSFTDLASANQFPNREHWLGTDAIGHDFLSRVIYGVRTSLMVGFAAVGIACLIGIPLGLLAGFRGGAIDFVIMRIVDVMTAFPGILFAIFLISVVGGGVANVIFVIGVTSWVGMCRLLRAQLLSLREQEYVTAARSIGATELSIAVRHLLPNAVSPMIIAITLAIPSAIFAEAGLSFLGIGINEPTPSLGKMVAESAPYIRVYWHLGFFPTLAIALAMLGFTFVGDGLRDALDTRQR